MKLRTLLLRCDYVVSEGNQLGAFGRGIRVQRFNLSSACDLML